MRVRKHGAFISRRVLHGAVIVGSAVVTLQAQAATPPAATTSAPASDDAATTQLGVVTIQAKRIAPSKVPTHQQRFDSAQSEKLISRKQIEAVGAGAGAAQALEMAPGVHVNGYGSGNTTRYSISINGIKQGWGGEPSGAGIDYGSIGVTFDGVPMNNPSTGLWQATLINQLSIIDGINVTYGPGDARERGFTDIGGRIDFLPVQPDYKAGGSAGFTAGSFDTYGAHALLQSGEHDGYSLVMGGGYTTANSFRDSVDGFNNGSHASAWYAKLRKTFSNGSFSLGGYYALARAYRPTAIPTSPVAGLTVNGLDANGNANPGPLFSQTTTGFYSALPYGVWRKVSKNQYGLVYSKLNLQLDDRSTLHNVLWYDHEQRLHDHFNNFDPTAANTYEYNNPFSKEFGDKVFVDVSLPLHNTLSTGLYYINSTYQTKQAFYNPNLGGSVTAPNAKYRANYWYEDKVAAFVQDKWQILPSVYVLPGLRFVSYSTDYVNNGAAEFPNATGKNQGTLPSAKTRMYKLEPSLDAHWQVLPYLALYANYSEAYKEPENGGGGGPYQSISASSVQLEKGRDLQGGVKLHLDRGYLLHHFLAEANVYQLNFSHQIIGHTLANGDTISAFGSSVYRGVNLSASDKPLQHLYVYANASYEFAHFKNYTPDGGPNYSGVAIAYVPDITFNAGLAYDYRLQPLTLTPHLAVQYTGSQHMFDDQANVTSARKVPSYTLVNVGMDATLPLPGGYIKQLKFGLDVENLLDHQYNTFEFISAGGYFQGPGAGAVLAYPGAGRSIFGTVTATF